MKLVASDMDGTIIDTTARISDRTVRAFDACRRAGVEIVFVTGRPPRWLGPLQEQLNFTGTVICSNGAVVYNIAERRVLRADAMPLATVSSAMELVRHKYPQALFAAETISGYHVEPGFAERPELLPSGLEPQLLSESLITETEIGRAAPAEGETAAPDPGAAVVKLLAKERGADPDDLLSVVQAAMGTRVAVTRSSPGLAVLEMSMPHVNKAAALCRFAAERGIAAADVIAFGDMPNDVQMLQWVGSGYAMASGHRSALEAAPFQAPAFAQDGVAQVLESRLAELSARTRA